MSGEEYNHVSISMDNALQNMYSFGRRSMRFPLNAGLVKENPTLGIFKKYGQTKCKVYKVTLSQQQYLQADAILNTFLKDMQEYRYNFIGLGAMKLGIPLHREKRYVCTQFVSYILEQSGIFNFDKHFSLIAPSDFEKCGAEKIFEGNLLDYYNFANSIRSQTQ